MGNITMLFEEHVLALPDQKVHAGESGKQLKYLNKNIPLLVLADYLKGSCKREKLMEILKNIQSGRHYYFTYSLPENAPLGKYELISEVHNNGKVKYSRTRREDHFWVEGISLKAVDEGQKGRMAIVQNQSAERTPVKIVRCLTDAGGAMETQVEVFEMLSHESKQIPLTKGRDFLIYNEEREIIALTKEPSPYLLRNQQLLSINKDGTAWVMPKEGETAFQLDPISKNLWEKADGLFHIRSLSEGEKDVFREMEEQGLIEQIKL
ncbi:hypothetical protein [Flagellimonas aurea]|uniref:hypothetical protein n=1 Tax=Flagellimonas aurea TaxID=2915619 RepID=UPI0035D106DB